MGGELPDATGREGYAGLAPIAINRSASPLRGAAPPKDGKRLPWERLQTEERFESSVPKTVIPPPLIASGGIDPPSRQQCRH